MRQGESFEHAIVADNYRHRPEYPDELHARLAALTPGTRCALDLGCGTGKIARKLSDYFDTVIAVDPSTEMMRVAKELQGGDSQNIVWQAGLAEDIETDVKFDLITAGASIHWMDHAVLFPRLQSMIHRDSVFVTVEGDDAYMPTWQGAWDEFLSKWIPALRDEAYEPDRQDSDYVKRMTRHRAWIDTQGESFVECAVDQTIENFVSCQHSRDAFAPFRMKDSIDQFDQELSDLLRPHAQNGVLTYTVRTHYEWGTIR